jgi:hypothetical protein
VSEMALRVVLGTRVLLGGECGFACERRSLCGVLVGVQTPLGVWLTVRSGDGSLAPQEA